MQPVEEHIARGFRYEQVGRYHNYHVTVDRWDWPECYGQRHNLLIDAFSPNLNKSLHVGHLRNLAVAACLSSLLDETCRFVALLGASLGVKKSSVQELERWFKFLSYEPQLYYDVLMPEDVISIREATEADLPKQEEGQPVIEGTPWVWDGPNGPVLVKRADGKKLYAFHDLAFAKEVGPTHYVTGHEQKKHFADLGLGPKHLPMGLILGSDGKKLKSRDGNAMSAVEAMEEVTNRLSDSPYMQKLAWNILAWNFLHVSRSQDIKFEVEKWTTPESGGMYTTYTYARIMSALKSCEGRPLGPEYIASPFLTPPHRDEFQQIDVNLLGFADQYKFWNNQAQEKLDPASYANFAHELARALGNAYHSEKIVGGRYAFQYALNHANSILGDCMCDLGMFVLDQV